MLKMLRISLLVLGTSSVCITQAQEYYEWPDPLDAVTVTTSENDLWPVSNLVQGPGEGFAVEEPNDQLGGGATHLWVTAADAGFPADYIEEVGQPVVQFDLGADRTLKEVSVWGYSATNSNGTSQFSLRFATEAEGGTDGLFGDPIQYGQSITYNPTFELFSNPTAQQYNLFEEVVTARYVELTNLDNFFIAPGDGSAPTEEPLPRLLPVLPGGDRVGLGEVAFMNLPESFQPGDLIPRSINGDEFGTLEVGGVRTGQVFGPAGDPEPGLLQEWYAVANPGSRAGLLDVFNSTAPAVPAFRAQSGITWWSGSMDVTDVPNYPTEVDGVITGNNYSVRLSGEILIEESGIIRFLDGVDDYTYLAIDIDGDGVAGSTADEILVDDNTWTNALSNANGGGPIVEVDFQGIAEGGEWRAMEFNMGEGGGGDHGMLYWDAMDEDDFFPLSQGEGVLDIDAAVFMIPDTHLQSSITPLIGADGAGSLAEAIGQPDVLELNVQVSPDGHDQIVLEDLAVGEGTNTLDVSGATIRIVANGEIAEGTEFQIFGADMVTGIDNLTLLFDDESLWNLSALSEGKLIFGPSGFQADFNGDGKVDFADFLVLSTQFNETVDPPGTPPDIDGSGTVDFADFLVLSTEFKISAGGAAAVPEPSSMALLSLASLLGGMLRRRHS